MICGTIYQKGVLPSENRRCLVMKEQWTRIARNSFIVNIRIALHTKKMLVLH